MNDGGREREQKGNLCFADMMLDGSFRSSSASCRSYAGGGGEEEGIHRFSHCLVRGRESVVQTRQVQKEARSSESSGHVKAGDAVTVSFDTIASLSEPRLQALAREFVLEQDRRGL